MIKEEEDAQGGDEDGGWMCVGVCVWGGGTHQAWTPGQQPAPLTTDGASPSWASGLEASPWRSGELQVGAVG